MKSVFCRIGIALVSCVGASAQIVQWNAAINAQNPLPYQIEQNERRITILAPATDPNEIFSFEAIDDGTGEPTDIDLITVASGVGGTIRVKVARQSGGWHAFAVLRVSMQIARKAADSDESVLL